MIWGAIFLAFVCWAITFGWTGGNFWIKIGLSVIAVSLYSLFWQRPRISFQPRSFLYGLLSAAALYFIFFMGNVAALQILPGAKTQVGAIYSLGAGVPKGLVFLLLFFITGPGEEIFWRGFLQERLMARWGNFPGCLMTIVLYSGVHVFSFNLLLLLAALVAGTFWSLLYLWRRDLLIQITSHSFWSAIIFAVAPVQ